MGIAVPGALAAKLINPDFVKFAESMHAIGYRINSADELIPTLEKAFEQKLTEHLKQLCQ